MVNVEKYVRKLLFEYDCVIIPDFGGLLTHHVGAHYDPTRGKFSPSTKRIAFNEVLRLDDGLLAYFISVNEHIVREEAIHVVKNYVEVLRSELKEGKTVTLSEIGSFTVNSEGKAVFEPDYTQNFTSEWFGLEAIEAHYCDKDQVLDGDYSEALAEVLAEETGLVPFQPVRWSKKWVSWAAAALVTGAIFTISLMYRPLDETLLSSLNPLEGINNFIATSVSKIQSNNYEEKNLPTLNQPVAAQAAKKIEATDVVQAKEEVIHEVKESEVPSFEAPVKVEPVAVKKEPSPGNYFLIAGSFEKASNARILKKRLIRKGFKHAEVLNGPQGKFVKVSAGGYHSMGQAMKHKVEVDEISQADSWVYHKR